MAQPPLSQHMARQPSLRIELFNICIKSVDPTAPDALRLRSVRPIAVLLRAAGRSRKTIPCSRGAPASGSSTANGFLNWWAWPSGTPATQKIVLAAGGDVSLDASIERSSLYLAALPDLNENPILTRFGEPIRETNLGRQRPGSHGH
jgi:hypothetical protein